MMKEKGGLEILTKENEVQAHKFVPYEWRTETQRVTIDAQNQELGEFEVAQKNNMKWKKFWKF